MLRGWAECLRGGGSQAWLRFPVLPRGHWLLNLAYVFCAGLVNLFLRVLVRSLPSCPRGGGVRACKRVCAHEHRHGRREGVSFTVKIPITLMPVASIVYGSCPSTQHRSLSVTPPRPPLMAGLWRSSFRDQLAQPRQAAQCSGRFFPTLTIRNPIPKTAAVHMAFPRSRGSIHTL